MILCVGCQSAICADELMCVIERKKFWHTRCLRCSECSKPLEDRCFHRNNRMYCPTDFYRVFGRNCAVCGGLVKNRQCVRMLGGKYFHENCFVCAICTNKFNTGDTFHTVQDKLLLCTDDYKSLKRSYEQMMGSPAIKDYNPTKRFLANTDKSKSISRRLNSESSESTAEATNKILRSQREKSSNSSDGEFEYEMDMQANESFGHENGAEGNITGNETSKSEKSEQTDDDSVKTTDQNLTVNEKKRGPRTTIKAKQLEMLKIAFTATPKPTRHAREQLAVDTGLNMRVIQVWFQNRRSKERRMRQMTIAATRRHWAMRNFSNQNGIHPQYEMTDADIIHMYPQLGPNFFGPPQLPQFQDMYCHEFYDQPPEMNGQQNPNMQQMMQHYQNSIVNMKHEHQFHQQLPTTHLPDCTGAPMTYQHYINPDYTYMNNGVPSNTFSNPVNVFDPTLPPSQVDDQANIIKRTYDKGQREITGNNGLPEQTTPMGDNDSESQSNIDELDIDTLLLQRKQKKK